MNPTLTHYASPDTTRASVRNRQNPLARRSSWPSSFATGLVGWPCLVLVAALLPDSPPELGSSLGFAAPVAVAQVLLLRALFVPLTLHRAKWRGALAGAVSGGLLTLGALPLSDLVAHRPVYWTLMGTYIGAPVGAFLSYFHLDDRALERHANAGSTVDYGRDAHWLEPFAYGAVGYLIVFMPRSLVAAVYVTLIGALLGVVAAGLSHFSPDRYKFEPLRLAGMILVGALPGMVTGWLLRHLAPDLVAPPLALGAVATVVVFGVTFVRGRHLASRERQRGARVVEHP